jgi:hypothetical protein
MSDAQQLARTIRDVLHDRLENSTQEELALEAATLRAFLFSTIDSLEHIDRHITAREINTHAQMHTVLEHLITRITHSMANLEDVRTELQRQREQ